MFFGSIATYKSFDGYKKIAINNSTSEIEDDLLYQIYAASKICDKKFKNHKQGILCSGIGLSLVLLWLIIGFLVYYI